MNIDRFIIGFAGSLVLIGTLLGMFVNDKFLYLSLFIGFMLLQASITNFCLMAWIVKKFGDQNFKKLIGYGKFLTSEKLEGFLRKSIAVLFVGSVVFFIGYVISLSVTECKSVLEIATFIITAFAFITAAFAFIWQKKSLEHQEKLGIKQEIIGAWQVLSNKASGNSGKREAIEFLVEQGIDLRGINLSEKSNGGKVLLDNLNVNLGNPAKLWKANFEGSELFKANFKKAKLEDAIFNCADLREADFELAYLDPSFFKGADLTLTIFKSAHLTKADFSPSENRATILQDADFSGSTLCRANFYCAWLYGAKFQNTNLAGANFQCANLMNADFTDVELWKYYSDQELFSRFKDSYILSDNADDLPRANNEYKFEFDLDENSEKKFKAFLKPDGTTTKKYFIKITLATRGSGSPDPDLNVCASIN